MCYDRSSFVLLLLNKKNVSFSWDWRTGAPSQENTETNEPLWSISVDLFWYFPLNNKRDFLIFFFFPNTGRSKIYLAGTFLCVPTEAKEIRSFSLNLKSLQKNRSVFKNNISKGELTSSLRQKNLEDIAREAQNEDIHILIHIQLLLEKLLEKADFHIFL